MQKAFHQHAQHSCMRQNNCCTIQGAFERLDKLITGAQDTFEQSVKMLKVKLEQASELIAAATLSYHYCQPNIMGS